MNEEAAEKPPEGEMVLYGEPYDWDKCTINLSIIIRPNDGNENGRLVIIGGATHNGPPLFETTRQIGWQNLFPVIASLAARLKEGLPERARIAESKRQAEKEAEEKRRLERQRIRENIAAARQKTPAKVSSPHKPADTKETGGQTPPEPAGSVQTSLF